MLTRTLAIRVPEPGIEEDSPLFRGARAGDVLTVDPMAPLDSGGPILLLNEIGAPFVLGVDD